MEEIMATHTVKPSSPTPLHLKTHRFSFIDQILEPAYFPAIFFYENDPCEHHTAISARLRQSLSEVLTVFYPFAGTVRENSFVDCNDSGAEMVEARVHTRLQQFTQNPDMEELEGLVPMGRFSHTDHRLVLVKASYFDCGGVALAVCFSHKVGDAASFIVFMNAWAATCRGETSQIIPPSFDMALHFPPMHKSNTAEHYHIRNTQEKPTMKRVVFEREKLEKLKQEASTWVKNPSRVEALSGFIWKAAIEACKAKAGVRDRGRARFVGSLTVNMRPRTVPPIPDHTIGNCAIAALAFASWEEDEKERDKGVHVSKIRAASRAVDNAYINSVVKDGDRFIRTQAEAGDLFGEGNCIISSWVRFPAYEVDFGWGKPVWVTAASTACSNTVILFSTPSGDGIEACVNVSDDRRDFIHVLQANCNNLLLH